MPGSPENYPLLTYLWVFLISVWGGIAHYIRKMKDGTLDRFSISELVGDIVISGFIGVVTFWLCEWAKVDPLLSAVFIAISAHMGTRALVLIEKQIMRAMLRWFKKG